MFDEPNRNGSRLPESPRINTLLAGLMGSSHATEPEEKSQEEAALPAPTSIAAQPFAAFLRAVRWNYVRATQSRVVVTPGMSIYDFFTRVNWSNKQDEAPPSLGDSARPQSVENLMSQCSWE